MAHKTLIDGTAYEISGGKTLIDSTAYEIDKGKTLVDGTAYEVGFGTPVTITLERFMSYTEDSINYYIKINGQEYHPGVTPTEITVMSGTVITCCATQIQVNGTTVSNSNSQIYEHEVTKPTTIQVINTGGLGILLISEKSLVKIAVSTAPTVTTYEVGDSFLSIGMVVTATYDNGGTVAIDGYTVIDGYSITAGQTYVTISYTESGITATTTQQISIGTNVHVSTAGEVLDSWEVVGYGKFVNRYSVGNYKYFTDTNGKSIKMVIVGLGIDTLNNGNPANVTWLSEEIIAISAMSTSTTMPSAAWDNSVIQKSLNNSGIINTIPSDVRNVVKYVKKTYYTGSGTADRPYYKFWIPSHQEIFGGFIRETSGVNYGVFSTRTARIKYYNGVAREWYLRSVNEYNNGFILVNAQGNYGTNTPNFEYGVVLGFCT